MKNKIVSIFVSIVGFTAVLFFLRPSTSANISIIINEKEYTMCRLSLHEFMSDGYYLLPMTNFGKTMFYNEDNNARLEAKTDYSVGVSLCPNGAEGAPIGVWLYNPKPKPIALREGMVNSISCHISDLQKEGITVIVAGLTLDAQTKEEIAAWAEEELKGFQKTENEDVNALSYQKGGHGYTFSFDDNDVLLNAIVRQRV